jgi:hypothetical protein
MNTNCVYIQLYWQKNLILLITIFKALILLLLLSAIILGSLFINSNKIIYGVLSGLSLLWLTAALLLYSTRIPKLIQNRDKCALCGITMTAQKS